jgi:hypothetical protein
MIHDQVEMILLKKRYSRLLLKQAPRKEGYNPYLDMKDFRRSQESLRRK